MSSAIAEAPSHLPTGLTVTGDLTSDQDLVIEGAFEGQIVSPERQVTIRQSGRVKGKVVAKAVSIAGNFDGTVVAAGRVTVSSTASVKAHLQTPSLVLADGAKFDGSVDPNRTEAAMHIAKYRQKHGEGEVGAR
jgi:cytoskeletal protein CcmA (bactofilin family)